MSRVRKSHFFLLLTVLLAALLAHAQTVALSPTSLSFGNQVVSTTSGAKTVTLNNGQSAILNISSIASSGDYAQTNNCGVSLAAGASCTVSITFSPTATGTQTGTLTVTDSASNSPQTTALTGTGVLPATLTPVSLSFGEQLVSTTSGTKTVTLKNNQTITLNISSIASSGNYAQSNNCGATLAAGASCTVNITFSPTTTGTRTGTLTVTDDASNSPQTTALTGMGFVAAAITSLSASIGPVGAAVTIAGRNFAASEGSSAVTFNGILATPSVWSNTSITVPVPPGTTTGNVLVTVNGVGSNGVLFTVAAAPSLTSLSPTSGQAGTAVTISGTNFGSVQNNSLVTFNGIAAAVTSWSSTLIAAQVPTLATTGNVQVSVSGLASNGISFSVTPSAPPSISSITPPAGPVGSAVVISGNNFGTSQGTSTVTFNGTPASTTWWTTGLITALVPVGASAGNIVVTVGGVASNGQAFTVGTAPIITSNNSSPVPVGQRTFILGSNFGASQGSSTITFNGSAVTPIAWNATEINFAVPANAVLGNTNTIVVTVNNLPSNTVNFAVGPAITSITPDVATNGASITISGTSFGTTQGTSSVSFSGVSGAPTSWSNTSIVVPVPAAVSAGLTDVFVVGAYVGGLADSNLYPFIVGTNAPSITSASPNSGPVGSPVTINGANFGPSTPRVTFNNTAAFQISSWTSTAITTVVPTNATTGQLVVDASGGGDTSNGVTFTVTTAPYITSVFPTAGGFGTTVEVQGSNFGTSQGSSTLTLNGIAIPSSSINSWQNTSLEFTVPTGSTTGNLAVTVGGVASNAVPFTVNPSPTITSGSSTFGSLGQTIAVVGYSFGASQGNSTVTINGVSASVASWSQTRVSATVPAAATTGNLVLTVNGVASNSWQFTVIPGISSMSPTWGPVGTLVTLTGTSFGTTQGSTTVSFGATAATPSSWSNTQIVVPVPAGATSDHISVTVQGTTGTFTASSPNFFVASAPTVTSISPSSGPIGTPVTLTGANFGQIGTVTFNGTSANYGTSNSNQIVVAVPSGATSGNVVVTVNAITTSSNGAPFTVTPGPEITTTSTPYSSHGAGSSGAIGTTVDIVGAGYGTSQGSSTVTFNGTAASPTSWNPGEIITNVPSGATTGNVVVTVGGQASNAIAFTVAAPPTITSVSPIAGGPGALVTITGTNFGSGSSSGQTCVSCPFSVQSWSNTSIVLQIATSYPWASSTPYETTLSVLTYASGVTSNRILFTILPPASITTMSPTSGQVGTAVTLAGSGFGATQSSSTVSFNGGLATPTSWSNASIIVPVPSGAIVGPVSVTVNGVSANAPGNFSPIPLITSVSPASGTTNQAVTISGGGFGPTITSGAIGGFFGCPGSSVTFNGNASHPFSWSSTAISAPVPNNATTGPIVVTTCAGTSNGVTFTVPTVSAGTISGTVTNALTGSGTGGISIAALQSGVTIVSTTTAPNGAYSIPGLAAGTYDIQATGTGYAAALITGNAVTVGSTTTVNVALSTTPLVNTLSPMWGGTGAVVTIQGSNFGPNQADSTGTVTFNGVTAVPTSWNNNSITVPVPTGATTGPVVVTIGGVASSGVAFSVGGGSLTGTITNRATGNPVNGAAVQALLSHVVEGTATSSSNGSYTITNLGPGTYDVVVSASGLGAPVTMGQTVTVGNATQLNVALQAVGTDSGSVTNGTTGISGASVYALQNGDVVAKGTTNSSGSFTISNLSAGTYSIQASAPGYTPQTTTGIAIAAGNNTATNFSLSGQSTLSYDYDALGRLVGVVDPLNGSAVYNYDAVGNVTSIQRLSSSQVGIISFVPTSGLVGTTVTITGANFSSTTSQDTVKFNGVAALVSSASPTQLVVTVPSGASSGPIQVTAPGGTGTSSNTFIVWTVATSPVPRITTVSPGVAGVGQTVTITGTNFDPNPANDNIILDGIVPAFISSATSTSLTFVVPTPAPTGPISVSNASGTATSSSYLFVVPSPYLASQVAYTGQISSIPGNQTVGLGANQIGILAFDATPGQIVTLLTSANAFPNECTVPATVIDPAGAAIDSISCFGWFSGTTVESPSLPQTGTYSLVLGPDSGGAGGENIAIGNVLSTVTGYMWLNGSNGPTVPVNIQTWGQNAMFTFNATAQQTATIHIAQNTVPGISVNVFSPSGAQLATTSQGGASFTLSIGTLPMTGSYLVQIVPSAGSQYVGTFNLSVTSP